MSASGAYEEEPKVRPRRRSSALGIAAGAAPGARGRTTRAPARIDCVGPDAFDVRATGGPTCADRTAGAAAVADRVELVLVPASAMGTIPKASAPKTNRERRARPRSVRRPLGTAVLGFTWSPLPTPGFSRSYNFFPGNSRLTTHVVPHGRSVSTTTQNCDGTQAEGRLGCWARREAECLCSLTGAFESYPCSGHTRLTPLRGTPPLSSRIAHSRKLEPPARCQGSRLRSEAIQA
jgi:hypothetical protein